MLSKQEHSKYRKQTGGDSWQMAECLYSGDPIEDFELVRAISRKHHPVSLRLNLLTLLGAATIVSLK
jgi:hypothetical protein